MYSLFKVKLSWAGTKPLCTEPRVELLIWNPDKSGFRMVVKKLIYKWSIFWMGSSSIVYSRSIFLSWGWFGVGVDGQAWPRMGWCMGEWWWWSSVVSSPPPPPCTHETHAQTHARPSLPVNPNPKSTPAEEYRPGVHYTAAGILIREPEWLKSRQMAATVFKFVFLKSDLLSICSTMGMASEWVSNFGPLCPSWGLEAFFAIWNNNYVVSSSWLKTSSKNAGLETHMCNGISTAHYDLYIR